MAFSELSRAAFIVPVKQICIAHIITKIQRSKMQCEHFSLCKNSHITRVGHQEQIRTGSKVTTPKESLRIVIINFAY